MPPETNGHPPGARPCWHCGGSGVRCCEFAADREASSASTRDSIERPAALGERGYRFSESPGQRCTVLTEYGVIQFERVTPDTVGARLLSDGKAIGIALGNDAAQDLLIGLAAIVGAEVAPHG